MESADIDKPEDDRTLGPGEGSNSRIPVSRTGESHSSGAKVEADEAFVGFLERYWPRNSAGRLSVARVAGPDNAKVEVDANRVIGRFLIRRVIGRGGFATVYLAYDPVADRDVALKVPHPETYLSGELRRRFEREGRASARLDHPHINPTYETSNSATEPYIASHYCAGSTLGEWLKRRVAPVSPRSAAQLAATLASAVQHAHERGILHRDLKPNNVLLDPVEGTTPRGGDIAFEEFIPRLSDFGLAKILEEIGDDDRTRTGVLLGTPRYMAPEQAIGDSARITSRTDVYALGVILYELLVGRPPFVGDTELETLRQVRSEEPVSIRRLQPNVERDLDTICMKCLEKEPSRRYASAGDLAVDLCRFLEGRSISARPRTMARRVNLWIRRHPAQAVALLLASSIAIGLPSGLAWHSFGLQGAIRVAEAERHKAESFELQARQSEQAAVANAANVEQLVYAADMRLANQLFKEGDFRAAAALVERYDPARTGGPDPRGFEWWYLHALCEIEKRTWKAHAGELSLLTFAAKGNVLLTASTSDGFARTWNALDGQKLAEVAIRKTNDLGEICAGALSPDGRLATTVVGRGQVVVWDAATGRVEAELRHADRVRCVAFSPDGALLLTGGDDATRLWRVGKWDAAERELVPTRLAQFSPDGHTLAIVWAPAFASHVSLLDAESLVERRTITSWTPIVDFSFSPDGKWLGVLVDTHDGSSVDLYNPATGAWSVGARWSETRLRGLAFAADGRLLATIAHNGGLRFWDTTIQQAAGGMRGAGAPISRFGFSPKPGWLATSAGGEVSLWDETYLGHAPRLEVSAAAAAPVLFHPVENRAAVASTNGDVMLVDTETSTVLVRLRGHLDAVADLAFSRDGARLASVDRRQVRLWNAQDGQPVWRADAAGARCVDWSPDGSLLATGGADRLVRLWDAGSGKSKSMLEGHGEEVEGLRFMPDGKRLISFGRDKTLRVWDINTGKEAAAPVSSGITYVGLAVDQQGLVAALAYGGQATFYRLGERGLETRGADFDWPKGSVPWILGYAGNVAFSRDGTLLGRAGPGHVLLVQEAETATRRYALSGRGIEPTSIDFAPDGRTLAVVGNSQGLTFWDTATWRGRQLRGGPLPAVRSLAFSEDSRTLLVAGDHADGAAARGYGDFPAAANVRLYGSSDQVQRPAGKTDYAPWQSTSDSLRLWDVETGVEQIAIESAETFTMIPTAAWSYEHNAIAASSRDGTLWVWDMKTGAIAGRRSLSNEARPSGDLLGYGNPALVEQRVVARYARRPLLAIAPSGRRMATLDTTGTVRLWDTERWNVVATLAEEFSHATGLLFSPDATNLVIVGGNKAAIYDVRTARRERELASLDGSAMLGGGFSPGGKVLALGTRGGSVQCFNQTSGRLLATLLGHTDGVSAVSYSPDGRTLASGGWDATVRLWNVASGREVAVLEGHRGRVHAVSFSPDGSVLASGGEINESSHPGLGEVYLWRGERATPASSAAPPP